MTDLDQIESIIADDHGGAWWGLFQQTENGHLFLPSGEIFSAAEYGEIQRRFQPQCALTPAEIRRNKLRGIADAADSGGRRYGR